MNSKFYPRARFVEEVPVRGLDAVGSAGPATVATACTATSRADACRGRSCAGVRLHGFRLVLLEAALLMPAWHDMQRSSGAIGC